MLLLSLAIVAAGVSASSSTSDHMIPPELPNYFQGKFIEYTAPLAGAPPYANGIPPPPFKASRGEVYYDYTQNPPAMIEVRDDYCVNIFPDFEPDFACTFHNVNNISYLISNTTDLPNCCVFGDPWKPPAPDFMRSDVNSRFGGHGDVNCSSADWYVLPSIPPPMGPFWYAFRDQASPQVYLSFSFPGVEGWVHQAFQDISYTQPEENIWKLPASCSTDPNNPPPSCGFFRK